jgi:predicted RecA/RadA family phage recombinase
MRSWLVVALLVHAVAAAPKPKPTPQAAVEELVRAHVVEMPKHKADSIADKAVVYLDLGQHPTIGDGPGERLGDSYYADVQAEITHKVTKLVVQLDDTNAFAWFQVQYDVTSLSGMDNSKATWPERAAGLAAKVGDAWKITAIAYTQLVSDHDLVTREPRFHMSDMPKGDPTVKGDAALAKTVAGWLKTGFAGHAAKATIASGSSPGELQSGAGVDKLVKSWDKLGLVPRTIEAAKVGSYAFVQAEVAMPIKNSKKTAPLFLYVVLDPDGKWVSLQYGATMMM